MKTEETWRLIPSLPEYLASDQGRVMRLPFVGKMPHGGPKYYGGDPHKGQWAELDQRYLIVFRGKPYKVASLICEAFHGPRPLGNVVMHLNEDSRDNRAENLSWGTQKENLNAPGFRAWLTSGGRYKDVTRYGLRLSRARAKKLVAQHTDQSETRP